MFVLHILALASQIPGIRGEYSAGTGLGLCLPGSEVHPGTGEVSTLWEQELDSEYAWGREQ